MLRLFRLRVALVWGVLLMGLPLHGGIVGSDTQNFNPNTDGLDFVTAKSSRVLGHLNFNVGLFVDHAINPLPYYESANADDFQTRGSLNDQLTSLDLHFALGISRFMNLGISVNSLLGQSVGEDKARAQFAENGSTAIRGNLKFSLLQMGRLGLGLELNVNYNQIVNNPFTGDGADIIYNLEFLLDFAISSRSLIALNLGYRGRDNGSNLPEFQIETINNQLIANIAYSYKFNNSLRLIGEIYGALPFTSGLFESERNINSAELIVALRKDFLRNLNLKAYFGVGTEVIHGLFTPDWRVFAGLNYHVDTNSRRAPPRVTPQPQPIRTAPAYIPPPRSESRPTAVLTIKDVLFKLNSDQILMGKAYRDLNRVATKVKQTKNFKKLVIEGHTCSLGSADYNRNLSARRAMSIRRMLVSKFGLSSSQIETKGLGEANPISDNRTEAGRKNNRRVEFKIYSN